MESDAEQPDLESSSYDGDPRTPERIDVNTLRVTSLRRGALLSYDRIHNGALTRAELVRFAIYSSVVALVGAVIVYLLATDLPAEDVCDDEDAEEDVTEVGNSGARLCNTRDLLLNLLLLSTLFIAVGVLAGVLAVKTHINVGYTRKSLHFASFFLPFAVNVVIPTQNHYSITMLKFWIILVVYVLATKPARRVIYPSLLMFRAIDRPSDRPRTLQWLVTQYLCSSVIVIALKTYWASLEEYDSDHLIMILVLVNGLGDGLAEPVGVKFGKHKYTARTLFFDGELCRRAERGRELFNGALYCSNAFSRSLEGSSVVYLVSLLSVLGFYNSFASTTQVVLAALFLPPIMTLTEAFSPHTLDSPFLFLIGGLVLTAILFV